MNTTRFSYPLKKIGLIGGGQLGKMTAQAAREMGFAIYVLDPQIQCPAASIADKHIIGSLYDSVKIRELAHLSDVLTYEIEHVDIETLKQLYDQGYPIYPSPYVLEVIQDKWRQKQVLAQHHIPVPKFQAVDDLNATFLAQAKFPLVQKARRGGYDGKGVAILRSIEDKEKILPVPSMIEEFVAFKKELAIMIARDKQGNIACYPVVEMVFDDRTNICDIVAAPATISPALAEQARKIAVDAICALDGIGVFGVEMFLTQDDQILVNEIAPRPHNSGHYTIEACLTSQFEQLVRIVSDLPLGSAKLLSPAVMLNLLGEAGYQGRPVITGLVETLSIAGLSFHFYDKSITRPFRKMGHITLLADDIETALMALDNVKKTLKIQGEDMIHD
ncbi:5-(carboxyamino)imidazole ribonucleotide synthase [Thioflexithrix psekupsensis]|uniref:N5-carboxyaminoimidazole ribonucleotide synthase n=1 Tax=Thioflexithrix psekupsensis TaxID=1570016 RepID=A0A251XB27_9GAMM|nr:5-(carboxyamino)imidazole ribonucleotide synthase [Thioflexithrix psekupsensis]OUD15498.1 5-(carboxyamino)imidazole ribonucleotide synthase [Thioflexithrix psekupsensis]